MKTIRTLLTVSTFLVFLVLVACQKDENPRMGLNMKATTTAATDPPSQQPIQDPSDKEPIFDEVLKLSWDEAWINVTQVKLRAEMESSPEETVGSKYIDFDWNGDQRVDLFRNNGIFANLELKEGRYRIIELELTSAHLNENREPNFYLAGKFGPEIGGIPIVLKVTHEFSISMRSESSFIHAEAEDILEGMIAVSLDNVFTGIRAADLDKAERIGGVIIISSAHNTDLYSKILANLGEQYFHERPGAKTWDFSYRQ